MSILSHICLSILAVYLISFVCFLSSLLYRGGYRIPILTQIFSLVKMGRKRGFGACSLGELSFLLFEISSLIHILFYLSTLMYHMRRYCRKQYSSKLSLVLLRSYPVIRMDTFKCVQSLVPDDIGQNHVSRTHFQLSQTFCVSVGIL